MRNPLFQAICRVGMLKICEKAIVNFRPNEAYEKYLKLLVSVMILIQLFLPIGSFLLGGGMEETARKLEQFRIQLEQEMQAVTREAAEADKLLENMTLEEIRRRVDEQQAGGEGEEGGVAEEGREEKSAGWNGTEEEGTGQKDTGGQEAAKEENGRQEGQRQENQSQENQRKEGAGQENQRKEGAGQENQRKEGAGQENQRQEGEGQDGEGVQTEAAGTVMIPEVSVPEISVSIEEGKAK